MSKSKYVIIRLGGFEEPFIFSETMQHSDVARALTHGDMTKVVSAGFCYINSHWRYTCYGESWSLKVKSREQDGDILNRMLCPEI